MPLAYAMYYIWGTRMLRGDYTYEFAIYPFAGRWQNADLHRKAIEYNYQPIGLCSPAGSGKRGDTVTPFTVTPTDAVVSAFYNVGDDLFVRLYEYEGRRQKVSLEHAMGGARLAEVDLAGKQVRDISGAFSLGPWQIKTIRLRPAEN